MFRAGENKFFVVENTASFWGFRIFTFFLSFQAAKALYVYRIIPGPNSVYRYLGDGGKENISQTNLWLLVYSKFDLNVHELVAC